jgi:hypothetical protein
MQLVAMLTLLTTQLARDYANNVVNTKLVTMLITLITMQQVAMSRTLPKNGDFSHTDPGCVHKYV